MGAEVAPLSAKKNMLWNSVGSFINLFAQWLVTVVVVRISSGYDAAGLYSLALSVYGIFIPLAQYRMYIYQVSDVRGENSVGEYFSLSIITNAVALILCFGYSFATCPANAVPVIMLYGVYRTAALLIDVLHACDQRYYRMDYLGISLGLQGMASLGLFVVVFSATLDLNTTLMAMAVGVVFIGWFYDRPKTVRLERIRLGISGRKALRFLWKCLPLALGSLACAMAVSAPRQYLFDFSGESALGIYASVAAPVAIIQSGASYIYYPLIGYFAEYFEQRDLKAFGRLFSKVTIAMVILGAVCSVLLALFGGWLLELVFGNGIGEYSYLLVPLIASAISVTYLWFLNDLLIAARDYRGAIAGSLVCVVVALVSMSPLIQAFGMNGVSYTGIVSYLAAVGVMGLSLWLHARKCLNSSDVDEGDARPAG